MAIDTSPCHLPQHATGSGAVAADGEDERTSQGLLIHTYNDRRRRLLLRTQRSSPPIASRIAALLTYFPVSAVASSLATATASSPTPIHPANCLLLSARLHPSPATTPPSSSPTARTLDSIPPTPKLHCSPRRRTCCSCDTAAAANCRGLVGIAHGVALVPSRWPFCAHKLFDGMAVELFRFLCQI
ncbi:hypothetical protein ACP70R_037987 [Stipagrostis hirtigluma subsp. patula]